MNKKYELKTTVAELESTEFGNYHKDLKNLQHDARLAHDLLERVAFLEWVVEQIVDFAEKAREGQEVDK